MKTILVLAMLGMTLAGCAAPYRPSEAECFSFSAEGGPCEFVPLEGAVIVGRGDG